MIEKGLLKTKKGKICFIKVLGNGELTKKLVVHADAFSKSAVTAIEKVGGKAHLIGESARGSVAS
jgi:large subunit ribosomal protein L15